MIFWISRSPPPVFDLSADTCRWLTGRRISTDYLLDCRVVLRWREWKFSVFHDWVSDCIVWAREKQCVWKGSKSRSHCNSLGRTLSIRSSSSDNRIEYLTFFICYSRKSIFGHQSTGALPYPMVISLERKRVLTSVFWDHHSLRFARRYLWP